MVPGAEDYKKYFVWFSSHNDYFRFREAELASLAELLALDLQVFWNGPNYNPSGPEVSKKPDPSLAFEKIVESSTHGSRAEHTLGRDDGVSDFIWLPSSCVEDIAKSLVNHSVLLKGVAEIWANGPDYCSMKRSLISDMETDPSLEAAVKHWISPMKTFRFHVETFGRHTTLEEQVRKMNNLSFLFTGKEKARMTNPDVELLIFERHQRNPEEQLPCLEHVFVGRNIARRMTAPFWWPYRLPIRPVLGPTTLDTELAFIMANCAKVHAGSVVLDPFVGTGSLLIAASHKGALCFGSDVDMRVLRGWGVSQLNKGVEHSGSNRTDVFYNFEHYGLPLPDIVRATASVWNTTARVRPWCDAVIADPPYGIRATVRDTTNARDGEISASNTVSNIEMAVANVVSDLIQLAERVLVPNGRLVFLLPVFSVAQTHAMLVKVASPEKCPTLRLEWAGLQELSAGTGRILVTMTKAEPPSKR